MVYVLSLVSIFFLLGLILIVGKKGWFQPAVVFLVMAIVDVLIPAIYWIAEGQVNNPEWLPLLNEEEIHSALLFYVPFLLLFIMAILLSDRQKSARYAVLEKIDVLEGRIRIVAALGLALVLLQIWLDVESRGGLQNWFWAKFIFSTLNEDGIASGAGSGFISIFPAREIFQAVAGLGFFYRDKFRKKKLFTFYLPSIAIILAMLTFLRGALLTCAITFLFAEAFRQKNEDEGKKMLLLKKNRTLVVSLIALFVSIYAYGTMRDGFRGLASSADVQEEAEFTMPTFLTAGHGLLGVSHIIESYGEKLPYLSGKTYIDMMLLPIPRVIYTSKPDWYGIDDITRGMGWPETTQSAVTMPGEAYANFGALGLLISVPLGIFFGLIHRAISSHQVSALLLGPTIFFQIPAVANWMSFTGIMNSMPLVVLLYLLSLYLRSPQSKKVLPRLESIAEK